MCSKKCWLTCGVITFAIIAIVSGLIYVITNPLLDSGVVEEFLVDSEESERYRYWRCKYTLPQLPENEYCYENPDAVPFEESYYFFNLTNPEEVEQGLEKPKYEEFGPYTYNVDILKFDVVFLQDGEIAEYNEKKSYYWNAELSCAGCTPEDEFVGINAGYLGAVDTAGSETLLLLGMGGPVIGKMIQDIHDTYIQALIANEGEGYWREVCQAIDPECQTTMDMAMVQWGYYKKGVPRRYGLNNVGVSEWNSTLFPATAEYGANMVTNLLAPEAPLNLTQCKLLLYGSKGIVEGPLFLLELIGSVLEPEELEATWGLSPQDLVVFGLYILGLADTYDLYLFNEVTVLQQGGGLFTKRNVHQWVFDFADPLLKYMQPRDPQTAIRYNDTSLEDARSYKPGKMAINTGAVDFRMVANVTFWNGSSVLDFWAEPVTVAGNNQEGQFFPQATNGRGKLPSPLEDYDIFSPDHGMTIYLADIGETVETPTGIKLHRYLLKNETYLPNPTYFGTLNGFINASFHMNPPFRKRIEYGAYVPLFFSQPRFWAVDNDLVNMVEFLNVEPNVQDCATIVDIEPISGNAMGAWKRLQVNFYVEPNTTAFQRFHPNMTTGVMYPVMWISQAIFVTESLEEEWNSALGIVLDIRDLVFIVGLSVGLVGFVLCLVGLILVSRSKEGYQSIN